jgi:hypothetical protein
MSELLKSFEEKKISKETIYARVVKNFDLLPEVLEGVNSSKASVRYGCSKVLVSLSADYPEKLHPYIDEFFAILDSKYRILTWNSLAIIANLATVDSENKLDMHLEKIFRFMNNEYMVTVANLIDSLGKIAKAKPYLIPKITTELLQVESLKTTPHLTEECKLVLAERALETFDKLIRKMSPEDKSKVLSFAKRCEHSKRTSLKIKAALLIKKWSDTQ